MVSGFNQFHEHQNIPEYTLNLKLMIDMTIFIMGIS